MAADVRAVVYERRQMPMEELQMAAGWIVAIAGAAGVLWKVYGKFAAVVEGIRCQLRSEMLRTYYRHKDEGRIRQYEAENFEHNYKAYVALGGNSFIGNVHKEVSEWEVVS